MRNLRVWLVSLFLSPLTACSGANETSPKEFWLVLSPDPEIADVVAEWACRWSNATGLDIRVGPEGVPVVAVDATESIADKCGITSVRVRSDFSFAGPIRVEIDITPPIGCTPMPYTVGHELGHALGGAHVDDQLSLMHGSVPTPSRRQVAPVIDDTALASVCETAPCSAFRPEDPLRTLTTCQSAH